VPAPSSGKGRLVVIENIENKEGKEMESGMFEVCSRVKNMRILAEFCPWKAEF
jgi:hypothetical protein